MRRLGELPALPDAGSGCESARGRLGATRTLRPSNGLPAQSNNASTASLHSRAAFDHAGFPLKRLVLDTLAELGHETIDLGTDSTDPVDYPDTARDAAIDDDAPIRYISGACPWKGGTKR